MKYIFFFAAAALLFGACWHAFILHCSAVCVSVVPGAGKLEPSNDDDIAHTENQKKQQRQKNKQKN